MASGTGSKTSGVRLETIGAGREVASHRRTPIDRLLRRCGTGLAAAWLTSTVPARAELVSWNAPQSCPPPPEAALVGTPSEPGHDEILVGVNVSETGDVWRGVLTARDPEGSPLGERVLEQRTCEELNRVVLVSLAVLLGAAPPTPSAEASDVTSPPVVAPSLAVQTPVSVAPPPAVPPAQAPPPAVPPAQAPPAQAPPAQAPPANELPPEDEPEDVAFAGSDSQGAGRSTSFDLLPALNAGLDLTSVTSLGIGVAGVVGLTKWALRFGAAFRTTVPAVDVVPGVSYSVVSLSAAACAPLSELRDWMLCLGPHLEQLQGSMEEASGQNAAAWLEGVSLGLTKFGGPSTGALGWFASLELVVRRGADFELSSPTVTVFEYPSVGLVLSLGPDLRL